MGDTIAMFGDVQGHHEAFCDVLGKLGVDVERGFVPPGLVVVQVGDLVHRGPDSDAVVALVHRMFENSPDRWVQLAGNHETMYFPFGECFFGEPRKTYELLDESVGRLREWWDSGWMKPAVAYRMDRQLFPPRRKKEIRQEGVGLATHAGLTFGVWDRCGRVNNPVDVANILNAHAHEPHPMWANGDMLEFVYPNFHAGIFWASTVELHGFWEQVERREDDPVCVPFHQVHGHSSEYRYSLQKWREPLNMWRVQQKKGAGVALPATHGWLPEGITRVDYTNCSIWGIDPAHSPSHAREKWEPLLFEGSILS